MAARGAKSKGTGSGLKTCTDICWTNYMECMRACPYNEEKVGRDTQCWGELEECQAQCQKQHGPG